MLINLGSAGMHIGADKDDEMTNFALTVKCPATRGIVASIAQFLAGQGCNITDSAQYDDPETDNFFMRVTFRSEEGADKESLTQAFDSIAKNFDMEFDL